MQTFYFILQITIIYSKINKTSTRRFAEIFDSEVVMAKAKKIPFLSTVAILLAASLWGCIGIFSRDMAENGFSVVQTVSIRALLTAVIMFIAICIKGPSLLKIRFRDIWMFLGTGICSFLFFNICYMTAINEASLSVAGILLYTSPFWVLLLSAPIFGEKITVVKLVAITICFGGSALLVFGAHLSWSLKGLVFGLLAGLGYALYSIFGKIAVRRYHSFTITFYTFLFAFIGTLPICDFKGLVTLMATPHNIYSSLGIAVVNTVLPYVLYTYGLKRINAGKASVIAIIEPVAAAVVGHFLFDEYITTIGIIGIVAVFLGLLLLENTSKR